MEAEKIELLKKLIDEAQLVIDSSTQTHIGESNCLIIHYLAIVTIAIIGGAIGGISRGSADRLSRGIPPSSNYSYSSWGNINKRISFWLQHIFLGIGGSCSAIFITLMFSKYVLDIASLQSITLYSSIAVLGGIMAKRCLPALGDRITNELIEKKVKHEFGIEMKGIEAQNKKVEQISKNYSAILADADVVLKKELEKRNIAEITLAIDNMEEAKHIFKTDRVFSIRLGRLYRAMFEKTNDSNYLDKAIIVLRKYIDAMEQNGKNSALDKKNMASAYFNIACYHSLKILKLESQAERLTLEAVSALKQSIDYDSNLKMDISDPDLNNIRESEIFKKTFDECRTK